MTSVFFSENKNKKKSKFSVVAAQKLLKVLRAVELIVQSFFFHKKIFFFKILIIQFPYMEIVWLSFFSYHFFFLFLMKRYQFRYQNNYKIPLNFD